MSFDDLTPENSNKILGADGLHEADVVFEDNVRKLVVKATTVATELPNLQFINVEEGGGGKDLAVNGSSTPIDFFINAPAAGQPDLVVSELRFTGFDNGIKIDNFMAQNNPLTNGILVQVKTNGTVSQFLPIKNTAEFESHFAFGNGGKYTIIVGSGNDFMSATFSPAQPFKLKAGSTNEIKVTVQDNLNTVASLEFIAFGYEDI